MLFDYIDDTHNLWDDLPYSTDVNILKNNHPLKIIVDLHRKELLEHPLLRALLHKKWKIASIVYFTFMAFYLCFVSLLSVYMVKAVPPYHLSPLVSGNHTNPTNWTDCNPNGYSEMTYENIAPYFIYILASMGLLSEIVQLVLTRWKYAEFHNFLDWFTYTTAIVIMQDYTGCRQFTEWQWQLGTVCIFISWLNMIFFLRRLPTLGIYVVMVTMILKTFTKFFLIVFLFLLTFALTFFLVMQTQQVFHDMKSSLLKGTVMMFSELDMIGIFHNSERWVPYQNLTAVLFVVFLIVNVITVMNLMTGLAVNDVSQLQQISVYEMLGMQIDLALDVELSLPAWFHSRWRQKIEQSASCDFPNALRRCLFSKITINSFMKFINGQLYMKAIRKEAVALVRKRTRQQYIQRRHRKEYEHVIKLHEDVEEVKSQLVTMKTIMEQILVNTGQKVNPSTSCH